MLPGLQGIIVRRWYVKDLAHMTEKCIFPIASDRVNHLAHSASVTIPCIIAFIP